MTLVILTEEPSMKEALKAVLKTLGIDDYTIISHQGVSDLERSLPIKLKAWRDPNAKFLILRDNDMGDCKARKRKLLQIILRTGKEDVSKVRIVCQELEAWFVGDVNALESSGYFTKTIPTRLRRCDPDQREKPSRDLGGLRKGYGKVLGAKKIAPHLDVNNNRSASFNVTIAAIRELTA